MEALVSGQAGRLALLRGDTVEVLDIQSPAKFVQYPGTALKNLFSGAEDVRQIKLASEKSAKYELQTAWQKDRALLLTLILLDPDEDQEIQRETPEILEPLIESDEVYEFVANRLYARPLEDMGNLKRALGLAKTKKALLKLLESINVNEVGIFKCRDAWEKLSSDFFEGDVKKDDLENVAIDFGLFQIVAGAITEGDYKAINYAKLKALTNPTFKRIMGHRNLVSAWLDSLIPKSINQKIKPSFELLLESEEADELVEPRYFRRTISDHDAFKQASTQIERIKSLIQKMQLDQARRFAEQLVKLQVKNDDADFAAKSLCNLAGYAEDTYQYSFALELSERAVEIAPEDGWSWGQLGNTYLHLARYDEADHALGQAAIWGEEHYAINGRARILWHQGQLANARKAFEAILLKFKNDDNVWNSHYWLAQICCEMGEYDTALEIYSAAVDRFPDKHLLRCGMGSELGYLGRFEEALAAYNDSIESTQPSLEAYVGIARTYKEMGDYISARNSYELAKRKYPHEPSPYRGLAEVLRLMGRHRDAIDIYKLMQNEFPFDYTGFRGTAETYREVGQYQKAEREFDSAISRSPGEVNLQLRRANLFKTSGDMEKALKAYSQACTKFPNNVFAKLGQADLFKELGKFDVALKHYSELLEDSSCGFDAAISTAAIMVTKGDFAEALQLLPDNQPRTKSEWVANHIRGMALLKSGKISDAVAHFESGISQLRFATEKPYFSNALALAQIKQRKYQEALDMLEDIDEPVTHILRLHTFGALNDIPSAELAYTSLKNRCPVSVVPLRDELGAQLKLNDNSPTHDSNWIFNQECNALALSITQQQAA